MKYVNAQNVLPEELIKTIQEYMDGEFLYIIICEIETELIAMVWLYCWFLATVTSNKLI